MLQPGDLTVVGVNANLSGCGEGNVDLISFVCFRDITTGTLIDITDNGWERANAGQWGNSEGFITVERTGPTIPAGTVITFQLPPVGQSDAYQAIAPDGDWAFTQLSNNTLNFNNGGDQIYFMQGGEWDNGNASPGNFANDATYSNGFILFGFNTKTGWNAFVDTSQDSGLHPEVEPCYHMEPSGSATDYISFNGPFAAAGQLEWIARISTPGNWTSYPDCPSYTAPPSSIDLQTADIDLACTVCSGCDTIQEQIRFILPDFGGPFTVTYTNGTDTLTASSLSNGDMDQVAVTKDVTFTVVSVEDAAGCPVFSNFGPGVEVLVEVAPPATEARLEGCAGPGGSATFDLRLLDETVNLGTGDPVSYYEDFGATLLISDPSAYLSPAKTIYAVVGANGCTSETVPIELTVIENPTLEAIIEKEITCNSFTDGKIRLNISGGAPPYRLDWSDDAFDNQAAPANLPAGTYSITVTDTKGCSDSTSVTLDAPPSLSVSCGESQAVSSIGGADGQAEVTIDGGVAPYEVQLTGPVSNGATLDAPGSLTIDNLTAGNYDVQVVDNNGCSISCVFTISAPGCTLNVSADKQDVTCDGLPDGAIDLTISGGSAPFDIDWDNDRLDGIEDPTDLPEGVYTVIITDANGCNATANATIESTFPALSVDISPGGPICPGECSGFNLLLEGTPPFTINYELSFDGSTSTESFTTDATQDFFELCPDELGLTGNEIQVNFLNLQDANCQRSIDQAEVITLLEESVTNLDTILCAGDSLVINDITYNAANPGGREVISGGSTNGCDSIVNISLRFTPAAEFRIDSTLCEGESITVNGQVYDEGTPSGVEVLKGQAASGCDSVITVELQYQRDTTVTLEPILCTGQSININGTIYDENRLSGTETLQRSSGCDSTVVVNVQLVDAVVNEVDSLLCRGESITLNGVTYNENNLSGRDTIPGGSFSGCDSIIVVDLRFTGGETRLDQTLCTGQSITVNGTVYDESNPFGTEILASSLPGCDSTVIVNLSFDLPTTTVIDSTLCEGESLTVNNIVYDIDNPSGTQVLQSSSGCDSTVQINLAFVPGATASIESGGNICPGESTDLTFRLSGAASATIQYSDDSGNIFQLDDISDGYSEPISPATTTTYSIDFVLVNGATCPAGVNGSVTVEVSDLSAAIEQVVDYSGFGVSCFGSTDGALQVEAGSSVPPLTIQWSNGATGERIEDLPAGEYGVTVSDGAGCTASDQLTLTEPDEILVQSSLIPPTCPGDQDGAIILEAIDGGSPAYSYRLDNGVFAPLVGDLPVFIRDIGSGSYLLTIEDNNGCQTSQSFEAAPQTLLSLDLGEDQVIRRGDSVQLSPAVNFTVDSLIWFPTEGLQQPDQLLTIARPLVSTTYRLTAFDPKGCDISDQVTITVEERSRIYAPNAFSPNDDGINDIFSLFARSDDVEAYTLRIYDRWGSLIFEQDTLAANVDREGWDGTIRGLEAHEGVYVYMAEVNYNDGTNETVTGEIVLLR